MWLCGKIIRFFYSNRPEWFIILKNIWYLIKQNNRLSNFKGEFQHKSLFLNNKEIVVLIFNFLSSLYYTRFSVDFLNILFCFSNYVINQTLFDINCSWIRFFVCYFLVSIRYSFMIKIFTYKSNHIALNIWNLLFKISKYIQIFKKKI